MKVKVADYIVDFFIQKGITDVFGYPGGMVTHLMEALRQKEHSIKAHVNYHEQAAAFCACGYAQASGIPGIAYATSGPGATNLITGICNAYFDSIPAIFITGQVNTFESKNDLGVRQRGFQETDIVSMINGVTKYSCYIADERFIKQELNKCWYIANEGRKGPVLLDIPMNIFRAIIDLEECPDFKAPEKKEQSAHVDEIIKMLCHSKRPALLVGAGAKNQRSRRLIKEFLKKFPIPTVSSMPAVDVLEHDHPLYFGFIGAYGNRTANFIAAKCDLLLAMGTRMDVRQIGAKKENFAPNAKLIRVEIDSGELTNKIKEDEIQIFGGLDGLIEQILEQGGAACEYQDWLNVCNHIKNELNDIDSRMPNRMIAGISREISEDVIITTDVGQNQVWVSQSFETKPGPQILFSGGHGAMGYSLPAAIGAYYAKRTKVISFNGDGGIQMNLQELQFIAREKLPITIVIFNNYALGMIRHFQEMYFDHHYYQTVASAGYSVPSFRKIAEAYDIRYYALRSEEDVGKIDWDLEEPQIVEVILTENTYVYPKLEFGKPNQDQEPLLNRDLYKELMEL